MGYLKRSVGWATVWLNRYHSDPFFRTEVNVIALQGVFALVILSVVGISFSLLYHDVTQAIIDGIRATAAGGAPGAAAPSIVEHIQEIKAQNLGVIVSVVLITTVLFGYIIARIALAPTRNALSSEHMEFAAVDLSEVVTETIEKFSPLAKKGGHEVELRKSPEGYVWGNPAGLTQIVGNLLKNAIQYSPRRGHISVTVEPAPDNHIELIVQDSGAGIARKDLFHIFEPFYRGDPSRTRGTGGSGLGLTIVSELVKMHHGKITMRSALGRGTTVSVVLPGIASHRVVGHEAPTKNALNEIAVDFSKR